MFHKQNKQIKGNLFDENAFEEQLVLGTTPFVADENWNNPAIISWQVGMARLAEAASSVNSCMKFLSHAIEDFDVNTDSKYM